MSKVLIVDDEESICWGLDKLCQSMGHATTICSSAEEGLSAAEADRHDLIVLDVRLPGLDGLNAMEKFNAIQEETPIVIMTAYGELDSAVAAIRNGAFEYLPKPFDLERVQSVIERALNHGDSKNSSADHDPSDPQSSSSSGQGPTGPGIFPANRQLGDIIGSCPKIQEVFRRIAFAATSNASVLINGESGTGKELAARAIHKYSSRSQNPFVAVNIAALSPTLAESELFGHVKGSFTGADHDRTGLLVQANGGTLFLDELAEIPLSIQVKLLRCLDQGEVIPIGSNSPVQTDFRIISATHQNLSQAVANGSFRHDLFFRICAFQIDLPALRDREDDAIQLARFFIQLSTTPDSTGRKPTLGASAIEEIKRRRWDGNVRELRNAIEHALILSRGGEILAEHLPEPVRTEAVTSDDSDPGDLQNRIGQLLRTWTENKIEAMKAGNTTPEDLYDEFLNLIEPEFLKTVMQHFDNQYVAASKVLGIHRTTLKKKMVDHGIDKE